MVTALTVPMIVGLSGCQGTGILAFRVGDRDTPATFDAPVPHTPASALRRLEWHWNERQIRGYGALFTDDFRFVMGNADSSGSIYRDPWTVTEEVKSATHLFVGGHQTLPPARSIELALDRSFFVYPDPSVPWDPRGRWYRTIRTQFDLRVAIVDGTVYNFVGVAQFSLVRGDSAALGARPRAPGFGPDSTRWYIRRWEEETGTPYPPEPGTTWGQLKHRYR
jgi:hypothetical protein